MQEKLKVKQIKFLDVGRMKTCDSLQDIYNATHESGLCVSTPTQILVLSKKALPDMQKAIGISGPILKKLKKSSLRIILNKCASVSDASILIDSEDGKIEKITKI